MNDGFTNRELRKRVLEIVKYYPAKTFGDAMRIAEAAFSWVCVAKGLIEQQERLDALDVVRCIGVRFDDAGQFIDAAGQVQAFATGQNTPED